MAINLSGKSDASIIASATRAGLASAPKDYSKIFESVTEGYQATMDAQAKMWDEIGKAVITIGKEAITKAEEFNVSKLYDINATQNYINDALDIKKELQEIGFFRKGFGDAETRQRRMELKSKQKKLFAEAEYVGSAIDNAAQNMVNLDFDLMKLEGETVNAIIASNTSNPLTTGGNQAKLGRNEKTGRPEWKIFNNGQPALDDITGEPVTMSVDRFKELTTNYVKDVDNVVPTAFNKMATNVLNGGKTFGGDFGAYHKGQVLTSLKNMTNTELGLLRSYKANYMGSSFFEDMTNPSELSATLFNSTLPKTDDGQLAAEGVLANLEDTDGKKGIGQQELINQFSIISGTILSGEPGRKLFEEWVLDKSKKIYNKGAELFRDPNSESNNENFNNTNKFGFISDKNYYSFYLDGQTSYITGQQIESAVESFKKVQDKGSGIFTGYDDISHKLKDGKWFTYNEETKDFTIPSNANSIFTSLMWNNNQKIMDYLKTVPLMLKGVNTEENKSVQYYLNLIKRPPNR